MGTFSTASTAILSADVKGYSRLMGEDEEGTIRILNAHLEVIAGFIQRHQGRVVTTAGDSVLAAFSSFIKGPASSASQIKRGRI